ncbi:MAG: transposase [Solirubrobacteraceae bacterium]
MNKYGRMAIRHWEKTDPDRFGQIPQSDRETFFTELGERAESEIQQLQDQLAGPDPAGESFLEKVGRLNMARLQAEERVQHRRHRRPVLQGSREVSLARHRGDLLGHGTAKAAREHAPQAIIAIDPYHVVAVANRALDEVRRGYWNELRRVGDRDAARRFKGARWSLLKAPDRLNDEQTATLRRLRRAGGEVWRAYTLKEALRAILQPGLTLEDVTILIDRFISKATRSRLTPFVRLAQTIRRHRDGILHAIRLGINQGRTEALNNKVRLITRRAYGFHSAEAALALVMLTCGPITLQPPHELRT